MVSSCRTESSFLSFCERSKGGGATTAPPLQERITEATVGDLNPHPRVYNIYGNP